MSKFKVIVGCALVGSAALVYLSSTREKKPVTLESFTPPTTAAPTVVVPLEHPLPAGEDRLSRLSEDSLLPAEVDRITRLFQPYPPLLPYVETVTYTSKVDWVTGRAAYLGDYAAHYKTSKHFISRSLHGVGEYLSDVVSKGERFNVLRTDHPLEFHMVVDLSRLKMWVYVYDTVEEQRMLLKSYPICAGKRDATALSGSLTPTGCFALGEEIAVYKEGRTGLWHQQKIEMMTVFGKRWIPLGREVAACTGPCRGLGIHGMPWTHNLETGEWREERDSIGQYQSDGCIRMISEDIAELFAVVVSRPSYLHIVRDFCQASLPGKIID